MKIKEGDKVQLTGTVTGVGSTAGEEEGGHLNINLDGGVMVGIDTKHVKLLAKAGKTASEESHVAEVPVAAPGQEQSQESVTPKTVKTKKPKAVKKNT